MTGPYQSGSYVLPVSGNYSLNCDTPAQVIEAFWAFRRTPDGRVIEDRDDMVLVYKEVDPTTWEDLDKTARFMTDELWAAAMSTKDHPHLI